MTLDIERALATLGLSSGVSLKECREAWHELSKQCHPDTQVPGSEEHQDALEHQRQLNAAYELLKKADLDKFPKPQYQTSSAEMPAMPADEHYQAARAIESKGDVLRALRMYEDLAVFGHAKAQFRLGFVYSDSIVKDIKQARHWWKRAAEQGHVLAQYNLALMYERGLGTDIDLQQAAHWFTEAANRGDAKAKERLGAIQASYMVADGAAPRSAEQQVGKPSNRPSHAPAQSMCGPVSETAGRAFISRKHQAS